MVQRVTVTIRTLQIAAAALLIGASLSGQRLFPTRESAPALGDLDESGLFRVKRRLVCRGASRTSHLARVSFVGPHDDFDSPSLVVLAPFHTPHLCVATSARSWMLVGTLWDGREPTTRIVRAEVSESDDRLKLEVAGELRGIDLIGADWEPTLGILLGSDSVSGQVGFCILERTDSEPTVGQVPRFEILGDHESFGVPVPSYMEPLIQWSASLDPSRGLVFDLGSEVAEFRLNCRLVLGPGQLVVEPRHSKRRNYSWTLEEVNRESGEDSRQLMLSDLRVSAPQAPFDRVFDLHEANSDAFCARGLIPANTENVTLAALPEFADEPGRRYVVRSPDLEDSLPIRPLVRYGVGGSLRGDSQIEAFLFDPGRVRLGASDFSIFAAWTDGVIHRSRRRGWPTRFDEEPPVPRDHVVTLSIGFRDPESGRDPVSIFRGVAVLDPQLQSRIVQRSTARGGAAHFDLPIPNSPELEGSIILMQIVISSPDGLSVSEVIGTEVKQNWLSVSPEAADLDPLRQAEAQSAWIRAVAGRVLVSGVRWSAGASEASSVEELYSEK